MTLFFLHVSSTSNIIWFFKMKLFYYLDRSVRSSFRPFVRQPRLFGNMSFSAPILDKGFIFIYLSLKFKELRYLWMLSSLFRSEVFFIREVHPFVRNWRLLSLIELSHWFQSYSLRYKVQFRKQSNLESLLESQSFSFLIR